MTIDVPLYKQQIESQVKALCLGEFKVENSVDNRVDLYKIADMYYSAFTRIHSYLLEYNNRLYLESRTGKV